jgi:hypothetical protein
MPQQDAEGLARSYPFLYPDFFPSRSEEGRLNSGGYSYFFL